MALLYPFRNLVVPIAVSTIIICKATPQAAVLGVLADSNGLDAKAAAGAVGFTTIVSRITLPVIAGACQLIF